MNFDEYLASLSPEEIEQLEEINDMVDILEKIVEEKDLYRPVFIGAIATIIVREVDNMYYNGHIMASRQLIQELLTSLAWLVTKYGDTELLSNEPPGGPMFG